MKIYLLFYYHAVARCYETDADPLMLEKSITNDDFVYTP